MTRKKNLKRKRVNKGKRDKPTFVIAVIAILISGCTLYMQFFYKITELQIDDVRLIDRSDRTYENRKVDIRLLFSNTGTNLVTLTEWYSFISTNESLPNNEYHYNNVIPSNSSLYTCCYSNINKVLEPNTVQSIDLSTSIRKEKLQEFIKINKIDTNTFLNIGVNMTFIGSNNEKITKELIVGTVQFNKKNTLLRSHNNKKIDLMIY